MAIFKCKMCGGALEIQNNATTVECEYCGTQQTLPKLDSEKKANLYDRANHFRRNNEFDKAMGIYEQILNEDSTDAEAYWSLVLCRYGIEYVEDPSTHKRVPTVNRAQFTSVFDDSNYKSALKNADTYQKTIYENEAQVINEIQKGILAISQNEEPFDIFICYKESDNNGRRTPDSVLANDLYHQLTQEGFRVFFSRITLEDKLGSAYEPYIFAALNSAKVMVALGTKPEHFNAVWVKNEWSRYLAMIKNGEKKMLIPAYKDMDPYDLPEEFSHLQAQDMSKLGFMQDLIRGIKKILDAEAPKETIVKETIISSSNANAAPLLKRAFMFLEDKEWASAEEYCEKVLDLDPECTEAYLGKLMVALKICNRQDLANCKEPFDQNSYYQKALRFADDDLKKELVGYIDQIVERNNNTAYTNAKSLMNTSKTESQFIKTSEKFKELGNYKDAADLAEECIVKAEAARLYSLYTAAVTAMNSASTKNNADAVAVFEGAADRFKNLGTYEDSEERVRICLEKAAVCRKDAVYDSAIAEMEKNTIPSLKKAIEYFETMKDWKNSSDKIYECERLINELKQKQEAERIEVERIAEANRIEAERIAELKRIEEEKRAKQAAIAAEEATRKKKKTLTTVTVLLCLCAVVAFVVTTIIIPNSKYNSAISLMDEGKVIEAYEQLVALDGYKDSTEKAESIKLQYELELLQNAKVGDNVYFGTYEQDPDSPNIKDKISWIVLEKKGEKALLVSEKGLKVAPYNETVVNNLTWENSTIRKWLNNDFLNTAFSADEKTAIPTVTVPADPAPDFDADPGNATKDQIFLLSANEAFDYFTSDFERQCLLSKVEMKNQGWETKNLHFVPWFLRTPVEDNRIACVLNSGSQWGVADMNTPLAIRPAMWVDMNP